jgi:hypothetical protein
MSAEKNRIRNSLDVIRGAVAPHTPKLGMSPLGAAEPGRAGRKALEHWGLDAPELDREMTPQEVIDAIPKDHFVWSFREPRYPFDCEGVWVMQTGRTLHYISYRDGECYDPLDGAILEPFQVMRRYEMGRWVACIFIFAPNGDATA